ARRGVSCRARRDRSYLPRRSARQPDAAVPARPESIEDRERPRATAEILGFRLEFPTHFSAVTTQTLLSASARSFAQRARAYYALTKPRVVSLIVFTAVI